MFETDAFFNTVFVRVFFWFSAILVRFGEAPGGAKVAKIGKTSLSGRVWSAFELSVRLQKGF